MTAILPVKRLSLWALMGVLLMSFSLVDPFTNVTSALKKGSVEELSQYFDNMVEITLPTNANSYSKSQAIVILKEFFSSNPVKDFQMIHKGNSGEGSSFGIGNLVTGKGTYRTTFFFKQKGDSFVIQELRFEKKKG